MRHPAAKFLTLGLTAVAAILVSLLVLEGLVRVFAPQQLVRAYNVPDPDLGTYVRPNFDYLDSYADPPYEVRTNDLAFRMDENVDRSPDRLRVIVYGDSFTFGWRVALRDTFFAHLKTSVEKKLPAVQLLNAGVGGYSSGHVHILMRRHLASLCPAAIVYFFNNNDVIDNMITDVDYRVTAYKIGPDGKVVLTDRRPFTPWKRYLLLHTPYGWLNQHSHLFVFAKDALKRALSWKRHLEIPDPAANPAPSAPKFVANEGDLGARRKDDAKYVAVSEAHLRRLAGMAEAAGLPLVVVWIPSRDELYPAWGSERLRALFARARRAFGALAAKTPALSFVDTVPPKVPPLDAAHDGAAMYTDDGHFSPAGNTWFAEAAGPPLLDLLERLRLSAPAGCRLR